MYLATINENGVMNLKESKEGIWWSLGRLGEFRKKEGNETIILIPQK